MSDRVLSSNPGAYSNVPVPDPSLLTTDQLRRELLSLRELIEAKLALHEEKFLSVNHRLLERDERAKATQDGIRDWMITALQWQKELVQAQDVANAAAIGKADAAMTKQIDGIVTLLTSNTKAADDKFAIINGRLDRGEGGTLAMQRGQTSLLAIVAIGISLLVASVTVIGAIRTSGVQSAPALISK